MILDFISIMILEAHPIFQMYYLISMEPKGGNDSSSHS